MKQLLHILILSLGACAWTHASESVVTYRETTGADVRIDERRLTETANGLRFETTQERFVLGRDLVTLEWAFHDEADQTDVTARRDGDHVLFSGTLQGKPVEMRVRVRGTWYQAIDLVLERFAASDADRIELSAFRSDDMSLARFVAHKTGVESVQVDGRSVRTHHVELRLAGLLSAFWKADYWFRTSDGRLVRYEASRGKKAPPTVIELVGER